MSTSWRCVRCFESIGQTSLRRCTEGRGLRPITKAVHEQPFSITTKESANILQIRSFSTSLSFQQNSGPKKHVVNNGPDGSNSETQLDSNSVKRKNARSKTATSLRRVAVEAQRSRDGLVKGSGRRRFIDPEAVTKDVTASCAAEQYNLAVAKHLLRQEGYEIDPLQTGLSPQVLHIQTPIYPTKDTRSGLETNVGPGDIFIFPSGSVVSWNVPQKVQKRLVHQVLAPAAINSHLETIELEDMEYIEDPNRSSSEVIGDAIVLGMQSHHVREAHDLQGDAVSGHPEMDMTLAKVAFSSGIARSTKLAVLENLLASYFETTKSIPIILSRGTKLRFTRSFILRKTGELLSIRAQLNLYSELTDTMPDIFWDSPSELGLSDYYDEVGRALDVNARIRTLNEKMDYASEIASVLRERLSEKHSNLAEWLIIFLISIEVGFELLRMWREHANSEDPNSTEELIRQWLIRQAAAENP